MKIKKGKLKISYFFCTICSSKIPLPRIYGQQREFGHIKDVWCYSCKRTTKHKERRYNDYWEENEMSNLVELVELQEELDNRIVVDHKLQGHDLYDRKRLALQVELGELANETRCFKFWSKKPSAPQDVILEEYVDGIHFIISLGIEIYGTDELKNKLATVTPWKGLDLVSKFERVFNASNKIRTNDGYLDLVNHYLGLGEMLGFSMNDIIKAYKSKNEKNHERQENDY